MNIVKKITIEDLNYISEVLPEGQHRLGFGTSSVSKQEYLNYTEKILRSQTHTTWGFFNNADMVSFMSSFDFPNLPYYGLLNFKVLQTSTYYSQVKSGFIDLINFISEQKEAEQRYTFFVTRAVLRRVDARKKLFDEWKNHAPDLYKKYLRTIEEVVPAGQLSKFDYFNKALLREKVFDNDMLIMKWTCRNEFRTNIMTAEQASVSASIDNDLAKGDSLSSF